MKYWISALLALTAAGSASAQESSPVIPSEPNRQWEEIAEDAQGTTFFDIAHIVVANGVVRFVGMARLKVPAFGIQTAQSLNEIQCATSRYRTLALDLYDSEGAYVSSQTAAPTEPDVPIAPGKPMDLVRTKYCP